MNKKEELAGNIQKFKGKKIAVIGDLMLDRFLIGDSIRISPEAPVPVVKIEKETIALGGAANVAANISSLGGEAILLGVVGKDNLAKEFLGLCKKHALNTAGVILDSARQTTEKTRLISTNKQVARIDRETLSLISPYVENKIITFVKNNIEAWDGIIFSDYDKGVITPAIPKAVISFAKKLKKPVIVDAKPKNLKYFKGATIVAPNQKETLEAAAASDLKTAGRFIQKKLSCHVLVTRGSEGVTLFCGKRIHNIPAVPCEVFDVTGAGDTVTAALALALVSGASLVNAMLIANCAASIVVGKAGTAVVFADELSRSLT